MQQVVMTESKEEIKEAENVTDNAENTMEKYKMLMKYLM